MLYASPRNYIFATPTSVILYDSETKTVLSELLINGARYTAWTNDGNMVAIISKHGTFCFVLTVNVVELTKAL